MKLELKLIELAQADTDGRLVLLDDRLIAVLSRLSDEHEASAGQWFIECGFGPLSGREDYFADLESAEAWFAKAVEIIPR